jgi:hypothetical protein
MIYDAIVRLICYAMWTGGGALVLAELLPLWTVGIWLMAMSFLAAVATTDPA